MNDTTRRFLNAVLERVDERRIVEVRLFPAIRQGGIESGVAVLAVDPEPVPQPDAIPQVMDADVVAMEGEAAGDTAYFAELPGHAEVIVPIEHPADAGVTEAEVVEVDASVLERVGTSPAEYPDVADEVFEALDREAALHVVADAVTVEMSIPPGDAVRGDEVTVEMEAAAVPADAPALEASEEVVLDDILALPPRESGVGAGASAAPERLEILCARYKLTFKGPDRGKWDLEVMHQADAPLDTLDRVIAGVVRRSGESLEPERFTRESLRASLNAPAWAGTP